MYFQVDISQFERGRKIVQRIRVRIFIKRLPVMIGKVFPYIPFYFQSDTIQLEVHAVEIGTDELVLVQERFLSQSLVQRRMERI